MARDHKSWQIGPNSCMLAAISQSVLCDKNSISQIIQEFLRNVLSRHQLICQHHFSRGDFNAQKFDQNGTCQNFASFRVSKPTFWTYTLCFGVLQTSNLECLSLFCELWLTRFLERFRRRFHALLAEDPGCSSFGYEPTQHVRKARQRRISQAEAWDANCSYSQDCKLLEPGFHNFKAQLKKRAKWSQECHFWAWN